MSTECFNEDNLTLSECPTSGNATVLVFGRLFYEPQVTVGGVLIEGVEILPEHILLTYGFDIDISAFSFLLPQGTGQTRMQISSGGYQSVEVVVIGYGIPRIEEVVGCTGVSALAVMDCSREGGDMVTLVGTNFGARDSIVIVAGVEIQLVEHDPFEPHSRVILHLPKGRRVQQPIKLFQDGGSMSKDAAELGYRQCPFGTEDHPEQSNTICLQCASGKFRSPKSGINLFPLFAF
jgi:hypothetical protein